MGQPKIPKKLKERSAAEWVVAIRGLRGHGMRARVANIVWWDFSKTFGCELEHWINDAYSEATLELPDELAMEGLRKLGYTEVMLKAKFAKKSQSMSEGKTDHDSKTFNRRDCTEKRAKKWNVKQRSVRCMGKI